MWEVKNVELDYWKYRPERWLISDKVRKMKHVAISGYRFLCDNCMMQELPGIIPDDDIVLSEWSRLTPREFSTHRQAILNNFILYKDKFGVQSWHHEYIKGLYREYHEQDYNRSAAGKFAVSHRKKKTGNFNVEIQPYTDVYAGYTPVKKREVSKELTSAPLQPAALGASVATGGAGEDGERGPMPVGFVDGLRKTLAEARAAK